MLRLSEIYPSLLYSLMRQHEEPDLHFEVRIVGSDSHDNGLFSAVALRTMSHQHTELHSMANGVEPFGDRVACCALTSP
jgi:hypothetical protein